MESIVALIRAERVDRCEDGPSVQLFLCGPGVEDAKPGISLQTVTHELHSSMRWKAS